MLKESFKIDSLISGKRMQKQRKPKDMSDKEWNRLRNYTAVANRYFLEACQYGDIDILKEALTNPLLDIHFDNDVALKAAKIRSHDDLIEYISNHYLLESELLHELSQLPRYSKEDIFFLGLVPDKLSLDQLKHICASRNWVKNTDKGSLKSGALSKSDYISILGREMKTWYETTTFTENDAILVQKLS